MTISNNLDFSDIDVLKRSTGLNFSDFVRRFERRAKSDKTVQEGLTTYAEGLMQDARMDYPDNHSADALLATHLLPYVPGSHFAATKRVLYDRMFLRWRKTDVLWIETALATALLAQPSIFGLGEEVEAWDGSIDEAMKHCYDQDKLKRLLKLADGPRSSTFRTKALQKIIELLSSEEQNFVGSCLNGLGPNPNSLHLIGKAAIEFIGRSAQLAAWRFAMPFTIIHLENEKVRIIYPDTIEVVGDLNRFGSTRNSQELIRENLDENEKRLWEAWEKLKKPKDSECIVRLIVDGISRNIRLL